MQRHISMILTLLALLLTSITPLTAQDTECEGGYRYFDHEFLASDPTCIPENPERVTYLLYPSYIYPFGINPVGSWGLERDAANFPYIADWVLEGTIDHGMPPNLEVLLELDPDLLLYDVSRVSEVIDELPNIAPLVTFDDTREYTWQERHRFNGEVLNQVELAEAQIAEYEARVKELELAVAETYGDVSDITVSVIRIRGEGAYSPVGKDWTTGNVLLDVGFDLPDAFELTPEEIVATFGEGRLILGDESIPLFNGDIILFVGSPGGVEAQENEGDPLIEAILADPLWQTLDAFATDDVYSKGDYWIQDGPLPAHMAIDDLLEILDLEIETPNPFLTVGEASAESFPVTVTDSAGREVTFDSLPERVMCFYTDCVEAMVGLGIKPAMVPAWFEEYLSFTLINAPGGMDDIELIPIEDGVPSAEAIAATAPDLVFVYNEEQAQALVDIAPTFVTYPVNSIDDIIANLRQYAPIFGLEAEAETVIERFLARRAAYSQLAPGDLSVMNVRADSGDLISGEIRLRGTSSPDCVLLAEFSECPWVNPSSETSWDFVTNIEYLLQEDPDVILISTYGNGNIESLQEQIANDSLWQELSAVKNDRVIIIDDDLSADGIVIATRFVDYVAPAIYPDIFPEPLTDEQVQEILAETE